ncbi:MAG TPA: HDOD domain-containing protein, partial [candidate division Zixibacteria bacterium]|nr:HDOD domain-containing protein [candidate division Zixibacteria bacterium]
MSQTSPMMEKAKRREESRRRLEEFLADGSLPSIPQVLFKIREVTDDPKSGVADLANVILSDHQLTTRILRMANSAYYGEYAGQVTRVTQAVALMGFRAVRNAALALAIYSAVARLARCPHFDFSAFWTRSLGVGVIAKQLAMIAGVRYSEEAFIAGFLHDVGLPLLATVFPAEYDRILEQAPAAEAFLRYEEDALGVNHMEAGAQLAKKWKLPSVLIAPIAEHHRTKRRDSERSPDHLVDFVYVACELYTHVMNKGAISAGALSKAKSEAFKLLGVRHENIDALIEDGRAMIVEIANELNMQITDPAHITPVEAAPALNSRLALRELQLSIIQGASEALMHAPDERTVLEIIRDGAFRGLELGSLTFFSIDPDDGALMGVCGYGVSHPSKAVAIRIPNDPASAELF